MKSQVILALTCAFALTGCPEKTTSPEPAAEQPAEQPAAEQPAAKPAAAAVDQPAKAPPKQPTAAELAAVIDKATRIEAKSGKWEKGEAWSKDLTKDDIASLKAGIGECTVTPHVPRCVTTVDVTLYEQDKVLAKLGAFCDRGEFTGPLRYEINDTMGSLEPKDIKKVGAALEQPKEKAK